MPAEQEISWEVSTHTHRERSVDWYWALGIIAIVSAVISVWLGNTLFAIIIILALGSLGVLAARGPREHSVHINTKGVFVDGTLYPYRSIESFWVERDETPKLLISTTGVITPRMNLSLPSEAEAERVRSFLKRYVHEVEQEAHFGEHLAEIFGL